MSANYFDRLEAELRAAVPHANHQRARVWRRWRGWRPGVGGLGVGFSVAVTLVVFVVAVVLLGHRHAPARPPVSHHRLVGPSGGSQYPLAAVPTLQQLLDNFAVLRRAQTPQDRTWHGRGGGVGARQLSGLTRLARTLPGGARVYLDVQQFTTPGQLNTAAGSYVLNITIVEHPGSGSGTSFMPSVNYNVYPIPSTGNNAIFASVIPDGVSTAQWTFGCPPRRASARSCAGGHPRTYTVPVINNVAASRLGLPGHTPGRACPACARAPQVTWFSASGQVVASFGLGYNLAAPPFIAGGRGYRALRVLLPSGVEGAALGESSPTAIQTITRLLGPPADVNVPTGGCGIDHESVWTSPAVANPLTIFERAGRFVGYRYGAPVSEIGLQRGPGAVLSTRRGLTLDDTVAVGRRLYGAEFVTRATGGGTWSATADGGTVRGAVLPIIYPLRTVTAKNPVATIQAGMTGCPSRGAQ